MLDPRQSVANLILDHSECALVFQRHHIDYCCGGKESLEQAAKAKGLALETLLEQLHAAIGQRQGVPIADPRELSTIRLLAHIVAHHHEYLRQALPLVEPLAFKVGRVHGERNPALRDLAMTVSELSTTLLPHLEDEETRLFPALLMRTPDQALLKRQFTEMMDDHRAVGKLLTKVRALSDEFTFPEWACNSYRTLMSELQKLESDVLTHVHLENHVLFPRFVLL